jgi:hypothetical protein
VKRIAAVAALLVTMLAVDDSFTMSVNGSLYVNGGPDINGATGNLFCSG